MNREAEPRPFSVDPLDVSLEDPYISRLRFADDWYEMGFEAGRQSHLGGFVLAALSGAVVGAILVLILTSAASAASRSAATAIPTAAQAVPAAPARKGHAASGNLSLPSETPRIMVSEDRRLDPPSVDPGRPAAAVIRGTATWYCGRGSSCTRGYGPGDLVAAIDPGLGIRKGASLTVTAGARSVIVRVVDVCACRGARVIDLTSGAFRRLAPLSAGTVAVTLTAGLALPGTDAQITRSAP